MSILIYTIYVLFVKIVCGEFFLTRTNDFYNVTLKNNSSCLIEAICMNINLLYIFYNNYHIEVLLDFMVMFRT